MSLIDLKLTIDAINPATGDGILVDLVAGNPINYGNSEASDYTALYTTAEGYWLVHWCDEVGCNLHLMSFIVPWRSFGVRNYSI